MEGVSIKTEIEIEIKQENPENNEVNYINIDYINVKPEYVDVTNGLKTEPKEDFNCKELPAPSSENTDIITAGLQGKVYENGCVRADTFLPRKMFDTEKMIIQIQQRPCLWNLSDKLYSDKVMKQKAWQEVAEDCFEEWHSLNYEDKGKKLDFLQKKWKYVRDYYMREKKKGTNDRSGSAAKKKRSCSYFDLLEFLNVTKPRYSNLTSTENSEKDSKNNARTITENMNSDTNVTGNKNNDINVTEDKNNDGNVTEAKNNDRNVTENENNDRNVTKNENNDKNITKNDNNDRNVSGSTNEEDTDDQFVPIEAISQRLTTTPASMDPVHQDLASSSKQMPGESLLGTKNKNINQESRPKQFDSHDEDPNRCFLLSLMPEMTKMTEKQNFAFRMEVMRSLNRVMYQIPD